MKQFIFGLFCLFLGQFRALSQETFQLAPPILVYENRFFEQKMAVAIKFEMAETAIHFTLDGSEPTEKSPKYRRPFFIKKNGTKLRARVFGAGFLPSEIVETQFFKTGFSIKKMTQTSANSKYPGLGDRNLIDGKGAKTDLHDPAWQGYQADSVELKFVFSKKETVSKMAVDALQNQGAWIFLPQNVSVFYKKPGSDALHFLVVKNFPASKNDPKTACKTLFVDFPKTKTSEIVVKIQPLARIPDWHAGAGSKAWLFLDEANFY